MKKVYSCSHCQKEFSSKYEKIKHVDRKHRPYFEYMCDICGQRFESLAVLGCHISRVHKKQITIEKYYNKYINKNARKTCKWCGKLMKFETLTKGYDSFCYNTSCNVLWYNKNTDRKERATKATIEVYKKGDISATQVGYWIKLGYSEEEARKKVTERQITFSKKICIEKYGEEEGLKRWETRQKKWQDTLKAKPLEERLDIEKRKFNYNGYSKISQTLFWDIYTHIKDKYEGIYFATLDRETKKETTKNNEYVVITGNEDFRFLDFYIEDNNKCIEFDGDYWHGEKRGNQQRDVIREQEIMESEPEMKIYHVKERDYKKNKYKVVKKCLEFINE